MRPHQTIHTGQTTVPHGDRGLLDLLDDHLTALTETPHPPTIDGQATGGGLPPRPIPLTELSAILMHPSCPHTTRDTVWRALVDRARANEPNWTLGALGVALPGLRFRAHLLSKLGEDGDIETALVEGFLRALRTVDTQRSGVVSKLLSSAFSTARAALRRPRPVPSPVPTPPGHPDLVLARAAEAGVITRADADLIGATRLDDVSLAEYAKATGRPRWALYKRRSIAERRLVEAIQDGFGDPSAEIVAEATGTLAAESPTTHPRT